MKIFEIPPHSNIAKKVRKYSDNHIYLTLLTTLIDLECSKNH